MELNQILRKKRQEYHLTQEQLAEKLYVSSKTVSNWETGKTFPDINSLIRLSKLYHISLDNLLVEGSDIVRDIDKKTRLMTLKKYMWLPSILNLILILIVSQQKFLGRLSTVSTVLILVSIALNSGILIYFNQEIKQEEQTSEASIHPNKQMQGFLLFVVLFVCSMIVGYLLKK